MADVLVQVAAAISVGAILIAPTHSVGPYRVAVQDQAQWACLDRHGTPVVVYESWDEVVEAFWGLDREERCREDWSAFAAARAFVSAVGELAAMRALRKSRGEDDRRVRAMEGG